MAFGMHNPPPDIIPARGFRAEREVDVPSELIRTSETAAAPEQPTEPAPIPRDPEAARFEELRKQIAEESPNSTSLQVRELAKRELAKRELAKEIAAASLPVDADDDTVVAAAKAAVAAMKLPTWELPCGGLIASRIEAELVRRRGMVEEAVIELHRVRAKRRTIIRQAASEAGALLRASSFRVTNSGLRDVALDLEVRAEALEDLVAQYERGFRDLVALVGSPDFVTRAQRLEEELGAVEAFSNATFDARIAELRSELGKVVADATEAYAAASRRWGQVQQLCGELGGAAALGVFEAPRSLMQSEAVRKVERFLQGLGPWRGAESWSLPDIRLHQEG